MLKDFVLPALLPGRRRRATLASVRRRNTVDDIPEKAWQRAGLRAEVSTPTDPGNLLAMSENGMAEAIATAGLFLKLIASVIAIAVSLASWGVIRCRLAAAAGATAVLVSFVGSLIICFSKQAEDREPQQKPPA